ncbi:MAG: ABC transporter ATP-binding protein [Thermomicrobiales bacterium]
MNPQPHAPLLRCADLRVTYHNGGRGLRGVDFTVQTGERVAIIGESGCGKSTFVRAILGLLPGGARIDGSIVVDRREIVGAGERDLRHMRGRLIGYVPQNPAGAFDPLRSVGSQVREAWACHGEHISQRDLAAALRDVGVQAAEELAHCRPSAWSGGMLQRAAIMAATALQPPIVLADEPTSALDRPLARQMLATLAARSQATVVVTHDIDLIADIVDRVVVMYAGYIVEDVPAASFFHGAGHPYSRALLAALCKPGQLPQELPGDPPDGTAEITGCAFAPRCPLRQPVCHLAMPAAASVRCHFAGAPGS